MNRWVEEIDKRIESCNTDSIASLKDTIDAIRQALFYAKGNVTHPSELKPSELKNAFDRFSVEYEAHVIECADTESEGRAILAANENWQKLKQAMSGLFNGK